MAEDVSVFLLERPKGDVRLYQRRRRRGSPEQQKRSVSLSCEQNKVTVDDHDLDGSRREEKRRSWRNGFLFWIDATFSMFRLRVG
jgi:hypothetical protein